MKNLLIGLTIWSSALSISTQADTNDLATKIIESNYLKESTSAENGVKCLFRADRGDFWSNGEMYTDLYLWFDSPQGHKGSASSLIGVMPSSLTDVELQELFSSKKGFESVNELKNTLIKVFVNGNERIIEVMPNDSDKYFQEANSTFYFKIKVVDNNVVQIEKKHWQKTFPLGRKELSFSDTCNFQ